MYKPGSTLSTTNKRKKGKNKSKSKHPPGLSFPTSKGSRNMIEGFVVNPYELAPQKIPPCGATVPGILCGSR